MDIYGRLADFPLMDLLTLCVDTMISGALTLTAGTDQHTLYFREGHLYHATDPNGGGFAAVWPLFEYTDAHYRFYIGARDRTQTISDVTPAVLVRARRLAQEWARIRPFIAGPCVVPILAAPSTADHVQINEEDWPVLSCIDGQRTINEIAQLAALEEIAVGYSLMQLQERGLVEIGTPGPRSQPLPAPVSTLSRVLQADGGATKVESSGSFFTKILATLPLEAPLCNDVSVLSDPGLPSLPLDNDAILRLIRKP